MENVSLPIPNRQIVAQSLDQFDLCRYNIRKEKSTLLPRDIPESQIRSPSPELYNAFQSTPSTSATPWYQSSFQDIRTKEFHQPLFLEKPLHSEDTVLTEIECFMSIRKDRFFNKKRHQSLPLVQKSLTLLPSRLYDLCARLGNSSDSKVFKASDINKSADKTLGFYRSNSKSEKDYWEYKAYEENYLKKNFFRPVVRSATEKLNIPTVYRGPKVKRNVSRQKTILNHLLPDGKPKSRKLQKAHTLLTSFYGSDLNEVSHSFSKNWSDKSNSFNLSNKKLSSELVDNELYTKPIWVNDRENKTYSIMKCMLCSCTNDKVNLFSSSFIPTTITIKFKSNYCSTAEFDVEVVAQIERHFKLTQVSSHSSTKITHSNASLNQTSESIQDDCMTHQYFADNEPYSQKENCSLFNIFTVHLRYEILSHLTSGYYTTDFLYTQQPKISLHRSKSVYSYFDIPTSIQPHKLFEEAFFSNFNCLQNLILYDIVNPWNFQRLFSLLQNFKVRMQYYTKCYEFCNHTALNQIIHFIDTLLESYEVQDLRSSNKRSKFSSAPSLRPVNSESCLSDKKFFNSIDSLSTDNIESDSSFSSISDSELSSTLLRSTAPRRRKQKKKKSLFINKLKRLKAHFFLHLYKGVYVYQIHNISNFYILGPTLGVGGEGHVKICIPTQIAKYFNISPNKINWLLQKPKLKKDFAYAIKVTPKSEWKSNLDVYSMAHFFGALKHPNVLDHIAFYEDDNNYFFLMELIEGPELLNYLLSIPSVSEALCKEIFRQVLTALEYIHKEGLVHRDVKLENFVCSDVSKSFPRVKLIDFGFACYQKDLPYIKPNGTPMYMAPELLINRFKPPFKYTESIDIWASGIMLCQLLTGKSPFDDGNVLNWLERVKQNEFEQYDNVVPVSNVVDFEDEEFEQIVERLKSDNLVAEDASQSEDEFLDAESFDYNCGFSSIQENKRSSLPNHIWNHFNQPQIKLESDKREPFKNLRNRSKSVPLISSKSRDPNCSIKKRNMARCNTVNASFAPQREFYRLRLNFDTPEWSHVADSVKNLVRRLLALDADKRLTASEALKHEWFQTSETVYDIILQNKENRKPSNNIQMKDFIPKEVKDCWKNFLSKDDDSLISHSCYSQNCSAELFSHSKAINVILENS